MHKREQSRRWTRIDDFGPHARQRQRFAERAQKARSKRRAVLPTAVPLGLAAVLAAVVLGSGAADEWTGGQSEISAAAAAITGTTRFSRCHVGGGSNCVVDGDTFYIRGEKVRIAGIDAPETHPSRCAREERLGEAATDRLQQLLNSGPVELTAIDRNRDRYGRLLRNVEVGGRDVGDVLVAEGVARPFGSGRRSWCG